MLAKFVDRFKNLPTPFYFYDVDLLQRTLRSSQQAARKHNYILHYALKANANDHILKIILNNGYGADCVSGNEVKKAIEVGFPQSHIVFAGVGKTDNEIEHALRNNI